MASSRPFIDSMRSTLWQVSVPREAYITLDGVQVDISPFLHSSLQLCDDLCDGPHTRLHTLEQII